MRRVALTTRSSRDYLKREHIQRLTEPVSAAADDLEEDLSPKERLSRERVVYANEIPMDGDSLFESLSGVPPIESDMDKILDGRKIPGVNTWFFYVAREHSMAYMHVENLSMFSINYMLPNSATKVGQRRGRCAVALHRLNLGVVRLPSALCEPRQPDPPRDGCTVPEKRKGEGRVRNVPSTSELVFR